MRARTFATTAAHALTAFGIALTWPAAAPAQQAEVAGEPDGFVYLAGGKTTIGSPAAERQREVDEVLHEVELSPFYVDPHEVRQSDYEALMGENPSGFKGGDLPVERVTWLDAVRYCNALSRKRGLTEAYTIEGEAVAWNRAADGYRLLTEAEWEYAARAGTTTPFSVGNRTSSDAINFQGSYPYLIEENYVVNRDSSVRTSRNRGRPIAVGSLAPNAFGLYDMHGNVSEWVFDYYGAYDAAQSRDPAGPAEGAYRVNRGGAYNDFGKHLRSAYRSAVNPVMRDHNLGFRIARNVVKSEKTASAADSVFATAAPKRVATPADPRMVVIFYSYSGNTGDAARLIARKLDLECLEITMQEPYWGEIYEATQKDMNAGVRPPLAGPMVDLKNYDVVLLGYPTWWATVPPPVLTFLESNDFAGKRVISFSSHGGTEFGDSVSDLAKTIPEASVGLALEFYYSGGRRLEERIDAWLGSNGIAVPAKE